MLYQRIETPEEFRKAVVFGDTAETRHLEFKAIYDWQSERRDEQADHAARDIAQFANTEGGVLLVGVSEREGPNGQRVADGVVPVQDLHGLRGWLEQTIRNHLDPATFSHSIIPVDTGKGTVLAVNVDPSLHLVALWHGNDRHGIEYLYRTNHGNAWMNPGEVERHLMNSSRAMTLRLKEIFNSANRDQPVDLAPAIHGFPPDVLVGTNLQAGLNVGDPYRLGGCRVIWSGLTETQVELTVHTPWRDGGAPVVALPHGLIREAWVTSDRRPGFCLAARIVLHPPGDSTAYDLDPM